MSNLPSIPEASTEACDGDLTPAQADRLAELEPIIEQGMASFVEVGNALLEISDKRLYRQTHSSFEEYCRDKWQMSARRAYQLCEASEVVNALPEVCVKNYTPNEAQARELAKVKPERRVEILEAAASTGTVTAASIARAASPTVPHVAHNSGDNEWYTPPAYIEAALEVMGSIDLDPASSPIANKTVMAATFFTEQDSGLTKIWGGNVWMNPPYGQPLIAQFAEKLTVEVEFGSVKQACVLVNNATETAWFQRMMERASAVCFPAGRVRFLDQDGKPGAPLQGQAIIYFGKRLAEFEQAFTPLGFVTLNTGRAAK